ncbi:DNAJ/HSP40 CYSTEINE-RICH DOMAIN SUPERFAMILY PROTEIN [Salix purpurea]|uniref:DNAJ/HSP40 CYSTEINE-RICH DOMAIN SUPERFAMILY PROTEIN n=1 Tax=Salix purpurea TaxID=77065 RepID=A0A9Q0ZRC6_SALPP|nr:DNAJ/HSP40 CYSTEINE-RICH DOMAIN SUPERFAMILY PROTEIN [Salix purpurea]
MDSAIRIGSSILLPTSSSSTPKLSNLQRNDKIGYGFRFSGNGCITKISAITPKGPVFPSASSHGVSSFLLSLFYFQSSSMRYVHGRRSSLESLFCYDTPIPEERIEEPVGVFLAAKVIGDNPRCTDCQVKGAVLCTTCSSLWLIC